MPGSAASGWDLVHGFGAALWAVLGSRGSLSCCSTQTFLLVVVPPRPLLAVSQCHHLLHGCVPASLNGTSNSLCLPGPMGVGLSGLPTSQLHRPASSPIITKCD